MSDLNVDKKKNHSKLYETYLSAECSLLALPTKSSQTGALDWMKLKY